MFGYDGGFIARVCNAFPSIASLCLEQAEEIKRLRDASVRLGIIADTLIHLLDDNECVTVNAHFKDLIEERRQIRQALSPSSHDN